MSMRQPTWSRPGSAHSLHCATSLVAFCLSRPQNLHSRLSPGRHGATFSLTSLHHSAPSASTWWENHHNSCQRQRHSGHPRPSQRCLHSKLSHGHQQSHNPRKTTKTRSYTTTWCKTINCCPPSKWPPDKTYITRSGRRVRFRLPWPTFSAGADVATYEYKEAKGTKNNRLVILADAKCNEQTKCWFNNTVLQMIIWPLSTANEWDLLFWTTFWKRPQANILLFALWKSPKNFILCFRGQVIEK